MNRVFEQGQAFAKLWMDFASKMMGTGMVFDHGSAPPEAMRQMRSALFQAMGQSTDEFMRSEEFLQMMKGSMDAAITFREQFNDWLTKMHHSVQGVAQQDVDGLLVSMRRTEQRILDRMEEISSRLEQIGRRLDAIESGDAGGKQPKQAKKPKEQATKTQE